MLTYLNNQVEIEITSNPYNIKIEEFFNVAYRINPKRFFLFVNNVLGKHIAAKPKDIMSYGNTLSMHFYEEIYGVKFDGDQFNNVSLPEKVVFVGFAETATALGQMVFAPYGKSSAKYIHSTREVVPNFPNPIIFEEEHSHATTHYFYANDEFFTDCDRIVLVDDELTTGKTAINMIKEMSERWDIKKFSIVSYLDWRSEEYIKTMDDFTKENGLEITVVSLMSGNIKCEGDAPILSEPETSIEVDSIPNMYVHTTKELSKTDYLSIENAVFLKGTGRFGTVDSEFDETIVEAKKIGDKLKTYRKSTKTLCLGIGEFMYIPLLVSSHMGEGVLFQATTRSPITPLQEKGYPIQDRIVFDWKQGGEVIKNYLYNLDRNDAEEIFLFIEDDAPLKELRQLLSLLGKHSEHIHYIYL